MNDENKYMCVCDKKKSAQHDNTCLQLFSLHIFPTLSCGDSNLPGPDSELSECHRDLSLRLLIATATATATYHTLLTHLVSACPT